MEYTWKKLVNLAKKCGFVIFEGGKHTKVKQKNGKFITTIARHNKLKKPHIKGVLYSFEKAGCKLAGK